jgi:hypothetical protein
VMLIRFLRTGGPQMLRMMDSPPSSADGQMTGAHSH